LAPCEIVAVITFSREVAAARAARRPVVVLESSVLAQGLPIPQNREAYERMTAAVRAAGAVPAVAAVVRGSLTLGLEGDALERFLARDGVRKVSARDLAFAMVRHEDGATTVAATLAIAVLAGESVFATGGIGGVHREPGYDESSDLFELSRSPVIVVCAGAKSILNLPATMERLESLGVPVLGYRCGEVPGFFTRGTGIALHRRADTPAEIAAIYGNQVKMGRRESLLVMQPPPDHAALDSALVEEAVESAVAEARRSGVQGASLTPFLLAAVERATGGRSLDVNLALLEENARLAAMIANNR
jgi:pseudouridylate synthase